MIEQENQKRYQLHCQRCGWDWYSKDEHPKRCAKCKNPYWDRPYIRIRKAEAPCDFGTSALAETGDTNEPI